MTTRCRHQWKILTEQQCHIGMPGVEEIAWCRRCGVARRRVPFGLPGGGMRFAYYRPRLPREENA